VRQSMYITIFFSENCFIHLVLQWVWYLIRQIKIKYTIQTLA
jgi:hypothetical protein